MRKVVDQVRNYHEWVIVCRQYENDELETIHEKCNRCEELADRVVTRVRRILRQDGRVIQDIVISKNPEPLPRFCPPIIIG